MKRTAFYCISVRNISPNINHAFLRTRESGITKETLIKENWDFTFFLKGEGICRVFNKEYHYKAGDVLIIPPHAPRTYTSLGVPTKYYWLNVELGYESLKKIPEKKSDYEEILLQTENNLVIPCLISQFPLPQIILDDIVELASHFHVYNNGVLCMRIKEKILALLIEILNYVNHFSLNPLYKFKKSIEYIETKTDSGGKILLSELCSLEGLTISHYIKKFKKEFKTTPIEFTILRRLDNAKKLMRTEKFSLKTIAEKTGFSDQYYFSKVFKKYEKTTPSLYYKNIINKLL